MNQLVRQFRRFRQTDASAATEYAVMLSLIVIVALAAIQLTGFKVSTCLNTIVNNF